MAEVRVIARFVAKAGREDQLRTTLRAMLRPTHAEAGEKVYDLYECDTPGRFYFYEIWASLQALELHNQTPHLKQLIAQVGDLIAEPVEVNRLTQQHP